ncbi:DUF4276 family protein [Ferrovum myxofaciens]|jgi:hypothetical protein|uniref:DUF4276 family protein n=1 Tax=Ferrovum myxofaciens TaxID=416213 RepID=UPI0004E16261|nr:DUF4276 family protein [Ferrovum myxofaciens]
MTVDHLEILVEEPSMEAFLQSLLPRMLPVHVSFSIYSYQCKDDLLCKLPSRLRGYAGWLPETSLIAVIVDRDDDDCSVLKQKMEKVAEEAGLSTRSNQNNGHWKVVNRIAIEELEAWYFGDWEAVREAYPRTNATIIRKEGFRDPDSIPGGTWEAFERVLKKSGYFKNGLRKIEVARILGERIDPHLNRSRSFQVFREALLEVI